MTDNERELLMKTATMAVGLSRASYVENMTALIENPGLKDLVGPQLESSVDNIVDLMVLQMRVKEPDVDVDLNLLKPHFRQKIFDSIRNDLDAMVGGLGEDEEFREYLEKTFGKEFK